MELVDGVVTIWNDDECVGVIETSATPGGCFVHFGAIEMEGYKELRVGQRVRLAYEPAQNQDGYFYRATLVIPVE